MNKEKSKNRIIFMGTSLFAKIILQSLYEDGYEIISVYTKPDKEIGKGNKSENSQVKNFSKKFNLKIFQPNKFSEKEISEIINQKPDIIVVASYGKILSKKILEIPSSGALNVHASILPKYRGPSPIQNAILDGESKTGITIMLMDEGIDTGDILTQEEVEIGRDEKYLEISEKMAGKASELLLKTIPLWIKNEIFPKKQKNDLATYCKMIKRADGRIFWAEEEAESIYNRFRAFYPWPGVFSYYKKNSSELRLKFHEMEFSRNDLNEECKPGEVFNFKDKIAIKARKGLIFPKKVQLEGKKINNIKDFINGDKDFLSKILK